MTRVELARLQPDIALSRRTGYGLGRPLNTYMPGALSAGSSVTSLSDSIYIRPWRHCRRIIGGTHLGSALPFNVDLSKTVLPGCGSNNTTLI